MKKLVSVLLSLAVFLSFVSFTTASAGEATLTLSLGVDYLIWVETFGLKDLPSDYSTEQENEEMNCLAVDNLAVYYNKNTFEFKTAALIIKHEGFTETEMDLRALGFFAAVEYGSMKNFTDEEIKKGRDLAMPILQALRRTQTSEADQIGQGHPVPFYVGSKCIYYIMQVTEDMQCIYVQ